MVNIQHYLLILSFILLVACAAIQTEHEALNFSLGKEKWVAVSIDEIKNKYLIINFIREGDEINEWLETVSITNHKIIKTNLHSPEKELLKFKQGVEKKCPGATSWFVIEKNKSSIVFEWKTKPCLDTHSLYGVGKIIIGKYDIFQVIYATRELLVLPSMRIKWIKKISSAKIEKQLKQKKH